MPNYLRKHGTDLTFIRTRILAQRPDMMPISEEEHVVCLTRLNATRKSEAWNRTQSLNVVEPKTTSDANKAKADEPPAPKTYEQMDEIELRKVAAERKIHVHHACKRETIIQKLQEVEADDANTANPEA